MPIYLKDGGYDVIYGFISVVFLTFRLKLWYRTGLGLKPCRLRLFYSIFNKAFYALETVAVCFLWNIRNMTLVKYNIKNCSVKDVQMTQVFVVERKLDHYGLYKYI